MEAAGSAPVSSGHGWRSFAEYRSAHVVAAMLSRTRIEHPAYEIALHALSQIDPRSLEGLARELRGEVRTLRQSYRSGVVRIDYSRLVRGYLTAYVPPYIQMSEHVWAEALPGPAQVGTSLNVVVVGAGPAPELVGLMNLLRWNEHQCTQVDAVCLDVADETWRPARIALTSEAALRWGGRLSLTSEPFDLTGPAAITEPVRSVLAAADAVVMQNCLNEGAVRTAAFSSNLVDMVQALRPGARLAIADIRGYQLVTSTIDGLLDDLVNEGLIRREPHEPAGVERAVLGRLPHDLRRHVLTDDEDLRPRRHLRYIVRVTERAGRRVAEAVPADDRPRPARPVPPPSPARRPQRPRRREDRRPEQRVSVEWERGVAYTGIVTVADGQRGVRLQSADAEVFIARHDLETGEPHPLASYVGRRLSFEVVHAAGGLVRGTRRGYLARRRKQFWDQVRHGARFFAEVVEVDGRSVVLERHGQRIRVPKGEISHDWVDDPHAFAVVGQLRPVQVLDLDRDRMRVTGSIKRCEPDPVQIFAEREEVGVLVPCEIVALEGQFARAEVGTLPAWVHVSEICDRFVRDPSDELHVGQQAWARYVGVRASSRRRGLQLSLKDVVASARVAHAFTAAMADEAFEDVDES